MNDLLIYLKNLSILLEIMIYIKQINILRRNIANVTIYLMILMIISKLFNKILIFIIFTSKMRL